MNISKMYFIYFILFYVTTSITSIDNDKNKCYVLALEGGGDKGAYQSGAIKGLVDFVPNKEVEWDVITGISVGALDGAVIALFEKGKESEAADFLIDTWKLIRGNYDIYQNWLLGPLYGLFYETGLYDTTPLRKKVETAIKDRKLERKFICGATNFETGALETWDQTVPQSDYENIVVSSGAFPVIFPLNNFRGNTYLDGGVKLSVDIASGINECTDMGFDDENIIVDVILLSSKVLPKQDPKSVHPLGVYMRMAEINGYDNAMKDFDYIKSVFPKVNFRYVVAPTKPLPSGSIPLTFSPAQIEDMINIGLEDAKDVVTKGPGVHFEMHNKKFREDREQMHGRRKKPKPNDEKSDKKTPELSQHESSDIQSNQENKQNSNIFLE